MLNFNNVTLQRGNRELFTNGTFIIHPGSKVGITGANGTGKSSLLSLILGEHHTERGDLFLPPKLVIAHVAQETPSTNDKAIDYVIAGDAELFSINNALNEALQREDGAKVAELHSKVDAIGGYAAPSRAAKLLHGLGFSANEQDQPVLQFSGGWRMRLNLAKALMCRSDLLLLDEPTNHLDLDAVMWLEEWLRSYSSILLFISHDRDFLDQVAHQILHIEHNTITLHNGNYSLFEKQRAAKLALQQATYQKQQQEIAHIRHFVSRFRAKASKAKQAQSRLKALSRMELIAPAHSDSQFHFSFSAVETLPNPLLRVEKATVGYSDNIVLHDITLSIIPGDRIGLIGPNGAGKSTLIKLIANAIPPQHGSRQLAKATRIGYFTQHQVDQLERQDSPLQHLQRLGPEQGEQSLLDFLGSFGFSGDRTHEAVKGFSGGEAARLALALLVYQRPNLLLLDEPTNHLDLDTRLALILALQDYQGAMILISHDRHLLRTVCDQLWLVCEQRIQPYEGDLDDYRQWLLSKQKASNAPISNQRDSAQSSSGKKDRRRLEAQQRQQLQPLRQQLNQLEKKLQNQQTQLTEIQEQLAEADIYSEKNKTRLKTLLKLQAELASAIEELEATWLSLAEELESKQHQLR